MLRKREPPRSQDLGGEKEEKNSSQDRRARSSVSGLLAQWLRRKTPRAEVLGSNPAGCRIRSRSLLSSSGELELWVDGQRARLE